ncbi:MAG: fibronectin type III domain-containing protein [Acidobacteria bacterium]|nr:fibronectin type III domain-containing protein [Acidobacteriota bacterium]
MRASALVITLFSVVAVACGGSPSPSAPSRPSIVTPTVSLNPFSASVRVSGSSSVDLARCLGAAGDTSCFAGGRPLMQVTTAGASAPGAPTGLTVTTVGTSVTLAWSAPTSGDAVFGYVIEAGSAPGLANLANFATGGPLTSYLATNVPGGTYYVRVRAQNGAGTSAASNEVAFTVGSSVCTPSAPTGLTSTVTGSSVSFSWTAPAGTCAATSYELDAGSSTGASNLAVVNTGSTSTTFSAANVASGTYYVRVRAVNGVNVSLASNEVIVTVGSTTTGGSLTGTWIGLSPDGFVWDASTGNCDLEHDMQLTLTQTGATLSGSLYDSVRKAARSACSSKVGVVTGPWTVTGTAGAGTLTVSATIFGQTLDFSGTFTSTRMTLSTLGGLGTLTLNRQ